MRLVLLMSIALFGSCDSAWDIPAHLHPMTSDHTSSDEQQWREEVEWAVTSWSLDGCIVPFIVDDTGYEIWLVTEDDWTWGANPGGVWLPDRIEVRGNHPSDHRPALLHELGHAIGLGHSEERLSVMYSSVIEDVLHLQDISLARIQLGCEL